MRSRRAVDSLRPCDFEPLFNFRHQRRAHHRGVGKTAQHRNVARQRNPEAHGDGKLRETARARRNSAGKSSGSESFAPVTPVREIRYRNPVEHAAIFASRSSVEVGAAKKNRVQAARLQGCAGSPRILPASDR